MGKMNSHEGAETRRGESGPELHSRGLERKLDLLTPSQIDAVKDAIRDLLIL